MCRWYKKYTAQECARLCSKISNFYGKSCTHFSRQWITTRITEHSDTCGRDGETIASDMPAHGAWGSAGVGAGAYTFRGQCLFFNSPNNHCCSTKAAWREAGADTDNNFCQGKFGDRKDAWDSKHRSWRLLTQAFTPTEAWPVVSAGRRLSDEARGLNGSEPLVHELFYPNGTRFWAIEDDADYAAPVEVQGAEADSTESKSSEEGELQEEGEQDLMGFGEGVMAALWDGFQQLWR